MAAGWSKPDNQSGRVADSSSGGSIGGTSSLEVGSPLDWQWRISWRGWVFRNPKANLAAVPARKAAARWEPGYTLRSSLVHLLRGVQPVRSKASAGAEGVSDLR